ncbi:protein phosphatase [Pseudohalocynthiibacter aestuariivivens]|uniref:Dual specificity protein phosphatase family protein n=1 Tax=Roseovarius pelagicus TaxID=2980108 RepID=A0ABY6DEN9_9RHOB|nr:MULTISPECIES: dual specificity protein phosphatase family protein [Rhodobacterales]QIE46842.1 protein phosphatase [Pseudohalocynthiibacter aestuariivivens]UXX84614.1 dual specificity protein phosphatase family protein [Roseovarius pelagicus]
MTGFVIYALPVAGGILALAPLPGRSDDYAADLAHLRDWRPALVISMTTMAEMQAEGAGDFGQDVQDMGSRWVHLPVEDFGTPNRDQQEAWQAASRAALAALSGGGRVLIHCRGGCGRSGMVALRLMIEAGETPDAALARLRAVRSCAVETAAQEAWAQGGEAMVPWTSSRKT